MINLYKKHFKKNLANLFTKDFLLIIVLLVGILFCNQAFSIENTIKFEKEDAATLTVTLIKTDPICEGFSNGTITSTVSGGVAPYTYIWNDGVSTPNRGSIPRGVYSVNVTDVLGATGSATITLIDPNPINVTGAGGNDVTCNSQSNGNRFINVNGGTLPYTYSWTLSGTVVSTTKDLTNKTVGIYQLTVLDANNCPGFATFTILEPGAILITETSHINNVEFGESNGAITLNVTGGIKGTSPAPLYTYLWNDGVTTKDRTGLPSGFYSVMVTDANNCTKPFSTNILPLVAFNVSGISLDNKCFGTPNGSINITATGGVLPYKYSWSDIGTVISPNRSNLGAGTYILTSIDANGLGATRKNTFTITEPPLLTMTATKTDNVCFSPPHTATITLKVSGGIPPYRYILNGEAPVSFTGDSFIIPNLPSRNYSVSIIDAGNCATTPPQIVDILPIKALAFKSKNPFNVRCSNPSSGSITVDIEGGVLPYTYKWSNDLTNNTPNNPNLTVGTYSLEVTDQLGCKITYDPIVIGREAAPITVTESTTLSDHVDNECFLNTDGTLQKNGKATININGGLAPYSVIWIYENSPITLTDNNPSAQIISVNNLSSGFFTLLVTDNLTCEATPLTIEIKPFTKITTNAVIVNQKCVGVNDASIKLGPTGGSPSYTYAWDSPIPIAQRGNSTVGPLGPGTYRLRMQDSKNCPLDTTFVITSAIPLIQLNTIIQKSDVCKGGLPNGSIKLTVGGGKPPYSFKWSIADSLTGNIITDLPPSPRNSLLPVNEDEIKDLPQGFYVVTVTDANGCITFLPSVDPLNPLAKTYQVLPVSCTLANDKLKVDPLMSPNDDGQGNNFFNINNIENFPDNEVIIYNRWGMEVFTIKRYNNQDRVFTGVANSALTNKNQVLVDGVYYYTIRTVQDKISRINKGYVIMKR